ncbi:hypothetical protein Tco_0200879 [Tanacetum coccineum]
MTTAATSLLPHRLSSWSDASREVFISSSTLRNAKNYLNNFKSCKTKVSYDLVIFREEHQYRLLRRGAWSSFEVRLDDALTKKGRMKPRRVRAVAMTNSVWSKGYDIDISSK